MLSFACDTCKKPALFEVTRTAHVVELEERDSDALTETFHACGDHLAPYASDALAARFTPKGKEARRMPDPTKKTK